MFDVAPSSNVSAVVEKLRSTSLGNCLQLIVGSQARTVVLHLACDEDDRADTRFLGQALIELSRVEGVARATIVRSGAVTIERQLHALDAELLSGFCCVASVDQG